MANEHIQKTPMYEKRNDIIISPKNAKPTSRIARFLEPFARTIDQVIPIPKKPLLADIFGHKNLQNWPINVHFTGWNKPQKDWKKWYKRLVINHATTWIKAGILGGIQASLHEIPCNKNLVLGLSEFWCPKTNTFIFPWGEATITLEDVMILGGFPVIGAPLSESIEGEALRVVEGLRKARKEMGRAASCVWMEYFMEETEEGEIDYEEGEFEHVAFLCLWLSRFVFPHVYDENVVGKNVIPIATHLSQGTSIALAPVVLANLYNDLTCLTNMGVDSHGKSSVYVSGLFHIVQIWLFERFPGFVVNLAKPLSLGFPRVARWANVNCDVTLPLVRSKLKEGEGFQWRPYACNVNHWVHFPFYDEKEQMISDSKVLDDCLMSFGRFLHSCELIGNDCKEIYQPHRVAMQFGYDQEIPARVSATSWDHVGFYVPARTFEPGVSRTYYDWWKDSMLHREESIMDILRNRDDNGGKVLVSSKQGEGDEHNEMEDKCTTVQNRVNTERPSLPLKVHVITAPELSKTMDLTSPASTNSKSKESHGLLTTQLSQNEGDKDCVAIEIDHVPLALRLCSKAVIQKARHVNDQKSQALSDPKTVLKSSYLLDLDHVPLASRLQSMSRKTETPGKTLESYGSTGNVQNIPQKLKPYDQTKALASPTSRVDSQTSRGKGNPGGTKGAEQGLEARVSKLEKVVYALDVSKNR